ncbi:ATP-dependent nuclease [Polaribacter sp.]|uniref:ATP-dependent nuclease n=2 Tax=Polaribacter sp. TaxID=1920175 RepID=UPI004047F6AF
MKIEKLNIENYRTIENLEIGLDSYYTAISGRNNSGKSNIIRILRFVLGENSMFSGDEVEINYKSDFPIWKKESNQPIKICATILLFKNFDSSLIKYVNTFGLGDKSIKEEDIKLELHFEFKHDITNPIIRLLVNETEIEEYKSKEIVEKIRNTKTLIFHNSTQTDISWAFRRNIHGFIDDFTSESSTGLNNKKHALTRELKKLIEKHRKDLSELIGRLEDKYSVGLNFPGINLDRIPFEITLGEKEFDIPLEDWGSGTKNRTLILKSIFNAKRIVESEDTENKSTPIVVIEEPESFLHPSAQAEFGRILQDLSEEYKIQIICTTHSPYLLSHKNPKSNILINRKIEQRKLRDAFVEEVEGENWRVPFETALGMIGPEFESLKEAFFSKENTILFVEGKIDKEYFDLLTKDIHGSNKLDFKGEIYSYDGFGFMTNTQLLKFIVERFNKLLITLDLDTADKVEPNLKKVGLVKNQDYIIIGKDISGKRNVEGLLPDFVINKVNGENTDLVQSLMSNNENERKNAKNSLKMKYLEEVKANAKPTEEYFGEFYKIVKQINKQLKGSS